MKAKPITDVTSIALGKKKWRYACKLFRTNSLKREQWHVDPLLGSYRGRSSYTTPIIE
jgi:hypothetical protein